MERMMQQNPLLELPSEDILLDGLSIRSDVFEMVKEEIEIMSEQEAVMQRLGLMTDLLPQAAFKGKISRAARLESGEITEAGIAEANVRLARSYVPATKGATIRCVDGRTEEGFNDSDPAWYELGPQVQGGTFDIAVSRRLARGNIAKANIKDDLEDAVSASGTDYQPGIHTDNHDHEPGKCGCGAINGQEDKAGYYLETELFESMNGVVGAIFGLDGKTLPRDALKNLPANAAELLNNKENYLGNKPEAAEFLKEFNANFKKIVQDGHNEYVLALNFVRGTTLNSNKFNAGSNDEYQAFGLDVWYIIDKFGDDAPYILADALGTVLNLTDGSLEVFARLPQEESLAA